MTTTPPLHSYMQSLLRHVEGAHISEVVIDNAITPTRSLRMKQRRPRRTRPIRCYSLSAFPESSSSKRSVLKKSNITSTSTSTRRGVDTVSQTIDNEGFQSPERPTKNKLSSREISPQSVLSPLSPRSARWNPSTRPSLVRQESDTALIYPKPLPPFLSPRSDRWNPTSTRPTLVRQESDTALIYPKRILESPRTRREYL
jgi:hypothetical protein